MHAAKLVVYLCTSIIMWQVLFFCLFFIIYKWLLYCVW